ncbi:hypothetical protein PRZ48_006661 [Zasmidium cellare]|uniref:Heterokaryon incompatibility domain-containing protein n=1 Tax=Zasmidium cellare TaxID=395010 RepID=A0ABR0EQ59_ZASCE|nr:hypothetical protein PRZ48_006661 [Zasmidium cellare]
MKDVYSRAERVLLWLGNDSDGSAKAALESIDKILAQCSESNNSSEALNSTSHNSPGHVQRTPLKLPHCDWTALRTLFSASLFFRVWVVQEIVLSKEAVCICGRFSRRWIHVSLAAQHLLHRGYWQDAYMGDACVGIHNVASLSRSARGGRTFLNWLVEGLFLKASLPLDKVYGMLGLLRMDEHRQLELKPDYTARVDVVYTTATRLAIDELAGRVNQLDHLHYAQALVVPDGQAGDDFEELVFPSWVPRYDWTYLPQRSPMVMPKFGDGVTSGLPASIRPHDPLNSHILSAKGLILSTVSDRSDMLPAEIFAKENGDLDGFATGFFSCKSLAQRGGHAVEAIAIALTSRRTADRNDALENVEALLNSYRRCVAACEQKTSLSRMELEAAVHDYREAMWHGTGNRVFFTTATGYMGTAHPAAKEGDVLAILFGAVFPVVLRADEEGRYRLVGDAYVHGVMEGSERQM